MHARSLSPVRSSEAFALIITMIMVVLAAVIAVGLLTSASLDRGTARSQNDRYQAELAVQNGLEAAKNALVASPSVASGKKPATSGDTFLVVRADAPPRTAGGKQPAYYFLAEAQAGGNGAIDYYPLFSGGTPQNVVNGINATTFTVTAPTAPATAFAPAPAEEKFGTTTRQFPQLLPHQEPVYTQWVEVADPNETATSPNHNRPYQRFAYWVEDLGGYVDASVAGNTAGAGNGNARPMDVTTAAKRYKTLPSELAMFTIFTPNAAADPGDTGAKPLISSRSLLFTTSTLHQLAPGTGNTDITTPVFATRLGADLEQPIVPLGFGYKDEGDMVNTKLEINGQVKAGGDAAVKAIAQKINVNLPQFGLNRFGGLNGQDYVSSIAASVIDYADADSDATIGADYRGIDSYPLVNEIYTAKNWTKKYLNTSTGTYFIEVTVDCWVELWNMTNQPISGDVSLKLTEHHPLHVGSTSPYTFGTASGDLHDQSTVNTTYPAGAYPLKVTMQPNEFKVFNVQTDTFQFNSGVTPPDSFPAPSPASQSLQMDLSPTQTRYELTWQGSGGTGTGSIVDKANNGIVRISGRLSGPSAGKSNRNWRGSLPGFIGNKSDGSANYYDTVGDPRVAYHWACPQAPNGYTDNSSLWSRNIRAGITLPATGPDYKEVKLTSWPDRGHDSATVTATPGTATKDPPATAPVPPELTKAPTAITNATALTNLGELGNIYDPGQWSIPPDSNRRWTDIGTTSAADGNYGGGMTLRVGRPEFTQFDQPGVRAWQLLDILAIGSSVNTRGLVNINTASRDALRVLGAGVLLNRDPDKLPAGDLYPPAISDQADRFADSVIAARPFLSTAQLSTLKVAGAPAYVFGDPAAWAGGKQPQPSEWNDSGTEEYFGKIYPLTSVRSRNFRVFITGQALDKQGKVVSTVSKVVQLYLNPTRDPSKSGAFKSQSVVMTYESQLP